MMALTSINLSSLWLSLKLASISTLILLIIGLPLANWLAHTRSRIKITIEALVAMPLVLPPTVLGFYLLIALGSQGVIGKTWQALSGSSLAFSFPALVIGSVIYSLPFVVQPLQTAFESIGRWPSEVAATLGANKWDRFFSIKLPLAKRGLLTAVVLGFAHTLGEFGVVLMIGGNIPGKTQLVSIDIYEKVEQFQYTQANTLSVILLVFSFLILVMLFSLNYKRCNIKV